MSHADVVPEVSPERSRVDAFAVALAELCRNHGFWVRGQFGGAVIVDAFEGEWLAGYAVHTTLLPRIYQFDRIFARLE